MDELINLYESYFNSIKKELKKWGCPSFIFEDIYHDAYFILLEKYKNTKTRDWLSAGYVVQICRRLWFKERKRLMIYEAIENYEQILGTEEKENSNKNILLANNIKKLPIKCREILFLYSENYSAKKISRLLMLNGEKNVKNRKYYCKEKLIKLIKEDPLFEEIYGRTIYIPGSEVPRERTDIGRNS